MEGAEPRYATPRNYDRRTLGGEVADVMAQLGTPPMPWQRYVLDVAYELDEEATERASSVAGFLHPRLWYREPRVTVPRQAGKTQKALGRHVHRQQYSRQHGWHQRPLSIYMAQTATDARDKMVEEWFPILEDSPYDELPPAPDEEREDDGLVHVRQYLRANGREAIKWDQGGRITTKPPSRKGGHGVSATQLVDLDESFAHQDASAEQGVRPSMVTAVSPQIWIVSTAGDATSTYLWGKVDDGRARCETGDFGRVCYFEWSADKERDDLSDSATRARIHPAVGFTIDAATLDAEYDSMDADEYARAYGNVWTTTVARIISAASWAGILRPASKIEGRKWLAVDSSPGAGTGRTASIVVGGRNEDRISHVEVIHNAPGLSWLASTVGNLTTRHPEIEEVIVDRTGPIASVLPDITREASCHIHEVTEREMAAACQRFHEDVVEGVNICHIGQAVLDAAVDGAAKRQLADSWAWARRTSVADISPLVGATLAHWEVVTHPDDLQRIR